MLVHFQSNSSRQKILVYSEYDAKSRHWHGIRFKESLVSCNDFRREMGEIELSIFNSQRFKENFGLLKIYDVRQT